MRSWAIIHRNFSARKSPYEYVHSVRIELAKLILVGTRITYQDTGDAGMPTSNSNSLFYSGVPQSIDHFESLSSLKQSCVIRNASFFRLYIFYPKLTKTLAWVVRNASFLCHNPPKARTKLGESQTIPSSARTFRKLAKGLVTRHPTLSGHNPSVPPYLVRAR